MRLKTLAKQGAQAWQDGQRLLPDFCRAVTSLTIPMTVDSPCAPNCLRPNRSEVGGGCRNRTDDRSFAVAATRFWAFQSVRRCSIDTARAQDLTQKRNTVKHAETRANTEEQVYPRGVSRRIRNSGSCSHRRSQENVPDWHGLSSAGTDAWPKTLSLRQFGAHEFLHSSGTRIGTYARVRLYEFLHTIRLRIVGVRQTVGARTIHLVGE
jgi:hypothetical protein